MPFRRYARLALRLLLATGAVAALPGESVAQVSRFDELFPRPFTRAELKLAYRLSLNEANAEREVAEHEAAWAGFRAAFERHERDPEGYRAEMPPGVEPAFGYQWSEHTLVLLSLLSDELYARVQAHRAASYGPYRDSVADRAFEEQRREYRAWVEQRLRELNEGRP